jgi:hypothetical protein
MRLPVVWPQSRGDTQMFCGGCFACTQACGT